MTRAYLDSRNATIASNIEFMRPRVAVAFTAQVLDKLSPEAIVAFMIAFCGNLQKKRYVEHVGFHSIHVGKELRRRDAERRERAR